MAPEHELPEDMLLQILEKLPAKSLLRLSCVCKSWNTLIKHPYFTEKHLNYVNNSHDHHDSPMIFLRSRHTDYSQDDFVSTHMERLLENKTGLINPPSIVATRCLRTHDPRESHDPTLEVINSSCNGILCLAHRACGFNSKCCLSTVCLYNPATQQELVLPPGIFDDKEVTTQKLGFGFDKSSNDYKVVRIRTGKRDANFVEIYRLSTRRWSKLNAELRHQDYIWNHREVLFNGFFHWLHGEEAENLSILTLDFHAETFGKIEFSGELYSLLQKGDYSVLSMAELDDSLAVFFMNRRTFHEAFKADVWVMDEYGNKSSWTKKFSLDSSITELRSCHCVQSFARDSRSLVLLCMTWNGTCLVTCSAQEDGEGGAKFTVKRKFDNEYNFTGVSFRPSLVSLPLDSWNDGVI